MTDPKHDAVSRDYRPQSPPPSYAGDHSHTNHQQAYQAEPYQQNGQAYQPSYAHAPAPQQSHELPAKAYGSQEHGHQYTNVDHSKGPGGYPTHTQQPQVVYVEVPAKKRRGRKDDVALGCCGGCLAACCCCGCTVM